MGVHPPWSLLFKPNSRKEARPAFFLGGPSFSGPAWRRGPWEVTPRGWLLWDLTPGAREDDSRAACHHCQIPTWQKSLDPW